MDLHDSRPGGAVTLTHGARHGVRPLAALLAVLLTGLLLVSGAAPSGAEQASGLPGVPRADAAMLDAGAHHTCAINASGSVRCWGENGVGELGQGNTASVGDDPGETPVPVDLGAGRTAVALAAGGAHTCAILDTGALRCWGANSSGQLGQGNTATVGDSPGESTVPVNLGAGRTAVAVTAGTAFTCAILDTGAVRCWGFNGHGQLGQGNTITIGDDAGESTVGVFLGVGRTAVAIAAGQAHVCAVLDTGALRCWGRNGDGQLAQGDTDDIGDDPGESTVPVALGVERTATAVAAGAHHACTVLDTGALRCWGANGRGQLGIGSTMHIGDTAGESTAAVNMGAGRTVTTVTAGADHTCVVVDTGALRCWGRNDHGQLGQGTTEDIADDGGETYVNLDLGAGQTALAITGGTLHSCAMLADRGVRCWGFNGDGELGTGATEDWGDDAGETPAGLPALQLADPATAPTPPPTPSPTPAPSVSRLKVTPKPVVSGKRARVSLRLDTAARVKVRLVSKHRYRIRGRLVRLTVKLSGRLAAGTRRVKIAAKPRTNVGRMALRKGRYVLKVRATNASGTGSARTGVKVVG